MGRTARRYGYAREAPGRGRDGARGSLRGRARIAIPVLVAVALLAVSLLDREIGLTRWWGLATDLEQAEARIEALRSELRALEIQRAELRDDDLAIERAIREELELALPGEVVVRSGPTASALARLP